MKQFRFGVGMTACASRREWIEKCRKAEQIGYDVIAVADHLGMLAPFPSLIAAAEATHSTRIATCVLNANFYNSALLARDVACVDSLTDGRIELGLGAGYVRREFEIAKLPWKPARERIDHLERVVAELCELLADQNHKPRPVQQPHPPLWLAGGGNRVLSLAARRADIIGISGISFPIEGEIGLLDDMPRVEERVNYVKRLLGARSSRVELNIAVQQVIITRDRYAAAAKLWRWKRSHSLSVPQMLEIPTILIGTPQQIAEQLLDFRARLGFTYITVSEYNMDALAPVIESLR